MADITMLSSEYEALISLAKQASPTEAIALRDSIDRVNEITRYTLCVRWKDVGGQPPRRLDLKQGWPVQEHAVIELLRKPSRTDVDDLLRTKAVNPAGAMVTPDPLGVVGWTFLDDYTF